MPSVFRDLFAATGAELESEAPELQVEPVTRYRFADGNTLDTADLPTAQEALEAWSPGASGDWVRFLGSALACGARPRRSSRARRPGARRRRRARRGRSARPRPRASLEHGARSRARTPATRGSA